MSPTGAPIAVTTPSAAPSAAPSATPSAAPSAAGATTAGSSGVKAGLAPSEPTTGKGQTPGAPGAVTGGCTSDRDCSGGTKCKTVQCVRAPCPKQCG
jgi:hypothetical protein